MSKLVISAEKSIYKPIEIVISGKTFKVKKANRSTYRKVQEIETEIKKGNIDAIYQQLEIFIGKSKYVDSLDVTEITQINEYIVTKLFAPDKKEKESDEEKNVKKPGENN